MSSTDSKPTAPQTPGVEQAKFCVAFIFRWVYPAAFALVTLSVVIVTLAAYEFQTRIIEGEASDARADASAGTEAKDAAAGASAKAELASELRALQASYRVFRRHADDRWAVFLDAERRVSDRLRPELYTKVRQERHERCPWLESIIERSSADAASQTPLAPLTSNAAVASTPAGPSPADAENAALTSAIEAHREYLNYERLIYELVPNKEDKAYLFTLYQDMMYFDNLRYITLGLIDPMTLAVMPPWMLTLIVTLAMGALGSCLHIVQSCIQESGKARSDYQPNSWFVLRPLLGVGTAFLVFVFFKAGLTLTEGKITDGSLNPYFIAVVAALAGLMSWQALASIQRWAERYFGADEISRDRWAYGLAGALDLKKPEKTVDGLATFLKEDKKLIELWMAEQQPVPENLQDRIADWLGIDRRYLFSDEK
jgi:hypothetical protein